MRFARTVLLTLCAAVLAYQGEVKAQSVVVPSIKAVKAQTMVVPSATEARTDEVDRNVAVAAVAGEGTFDFLREGFPVDKLGLATFEDCGPDKGKCSSGHCCQVGSSGWCCPNDKKCDYDNPGDCK